MLRLDKFLCDMKAGTRSQVKALIRKGQVTVDGLPAKSPEMKIEESSAQVCVNGKSISYARHVYFMLNKPAGCVSATQDNHDKTVLQLMREQKGAFDDALLQRELFPVGRLDKDTEGLLLITDDGELAHRLLSPAAHVEKTYYVEIDGMLTGAQQKSLQEGVDIGEKNLTRPAVLKQEQGLSFRHAAAVSAWRLTITEGKFHQVKRMLQAVGRNVVYLKRIRMGTLLLDETLAPGAFRLLTEEELSGLREE
ncbi:pseudouridine synthase [Eisenbergiella sp.]